MSVAYFLKIPKLETVIKVAPEASPRTGNQELFSEALKDLEHLLERNDVGSIAEEHINQLTSSDLATLIKIAEEANHVFGIAWRSNFLVWLLTKAYPLDCEVISEFDFTKNEVGWKLVDYDGEVFEITGVTDDGQAKWWDEKPEERVQID